MDPGEDDFDMETTLFSNITGEDDRASLPNQPKDISKIHYQLIIDIVITSYSIAWLCWFLFKYRKKLGPVYIMDLNIYAEWTLGKENSLHL